MQFPITIGLHRSRFLGWVLFAATCIAIAAMGSFLRSTGIFAYFSLLIGGLHVLTWRRLTPTVETLRLEEGGLLSIRHRGDRQFVAARLLPGATVHPWLTVFRTESEDGRRDVVVVASDMLPPDDFRRLRIFLRWRAAFSASADAA